MAGLKKVSDTFSAGAVTVLGIAAEGFMGI